MLKQELFNCECQPYIASRVPYTLRYGRNYRNTLRDIDVISRLSGPELQTRITGQMARLVSHAYRTIPFYRDFYDTHGFKPQSVKGFDDLQQIPVVSKKELQQVALGNRSGDPRRCRKANTGGTTGQPLDFYVPKISDAFEYAHMHAIWRRADYKPTELKLSFRGENLGSQAFIYRIGQNEVVLNTYVPAAKQCEAIQEHMCGFPSVRYLHGYPSLVARFCDALIDFPKLKLTLQENVKGVFLGSEFPAPHYREKIKEVFNIPVLSWYGHTERAVLAGELQHEYEYEPFLTYGYAEAVADGSGRFKLVATGFSNPVSPFIRYDTGDHIEPVRQDAGILKSFRIKEGREAEEVFDRNGNPISLTGLIFGRHHAIFNHVQHLQVEQRDPGKIVVWITSPETQDWSGLFDASGLELAVEFKTRKEPYRSGTGKVPLLIRCKHYCKSGEEK